LPGLLLEISGELLLDVGLVADIDILEPLEVTFVHRDLDWLHVVEDRVLLGLHLPLTLELSLDGILHRVLLRLCVIVMEHRHLVLHKL
jgi:hypothetical protein